MKTLCTLLALAIGLAAYSQEEKTLIDVCDDFNYPHLEASLDQLKSSSNDDLKFRWNTSAYREIVAGYFEHVISLEKHVKKNVDPQTYQVTRYRIELISKNKEATTFYRITEIQRKKIAGEWQDDPIILAQDSTRVLADCKAKFRKVYSVPLETQQLFTTSVTYGSSCGYGGTPMPFYEQLQQMIEWRDTTGLTQWLRSPTAEIQIFGIEGIYTLQRSGMEINESTMELVDVISKKKGNVSVCGGCIFYTESIDHVVELIRRDTLLMK